ncbi:MAG TPA: Gfo/Idh/MocA family oxidoreductase [Flavisolibacter sp.]|nr:Gfo/Idh/MocA family oxidoreductase [Flavisolibacter sp.]
MQRRNFIKSGTIAVGGALLAPLPLFGAEEKIKIAILGTGWWGTDFLLPNLLSSGQFEVIGLCDVNSVSLKKAATKVKEAGGKEPGLFSSYHQMFEMPGLQAVVIATPTHWHALQFIAACKKGLHVFLEKPISYDIREGQAMTEAHRKAKNVVQVDFPRVMVDTNEQVRAFLKSGEAGRILQVQANIHNPEGQVVERPVPSTLNFDAFCGPAPRTKFLCNENSDVPNWRAQHAFSRGVMADWGIHYIHNIRKVLNLGLPDNVSAVGGTVRVHSHDNPDQLDVRFDYAGLPVYWTHRSWGFTSPNPDNNIGVFYFGEKATVFAGDLGWEVYPAAMGAKKTHGNIRFEPGNPEHIPLYTKMMVDLFKEFADGIRKRSNEGITNKLEDAERTTATVIYGDMAYRTKSNLAINTSTMDITNNKEAQALLKRSYRAPYVHP